MEREARENTLTYEQRKELRLEKSLPILHAISAWMIDQLPDVLPNSPPGKVLRYPFACGMNPSPISTTAGSRSTTTLWRILFN